MLALVLTACRDDPAPAPTPQAGAATASPARPASPDPTPPPESEEVPATASCGEELRATLTDVVDAQLDAIGDRDWARALESASDSFRDGVDVAGFERIILDGFPVVADASARDVGTCIAADDQATLTVTVEDRDASQQSLLYLMELDGERWGIAGAVPTDDDRAPGAPADPDEPTIST